jgi:hypothetical protein
MTVFYAQDYMVGGLYIHGGDRETHYTPMPEGLKKVWEIEPVPPGDTTPWVRGDGDYWTVAAEGHEELALSWEELLEEFGPLTDDETEAAMGLEALDALNRAANSAWEVAS